MGLEKNYISADDKNVGSRFLYVTVDKTTGDVTGVYNDAQHTQKVCAEDVIAAYTSGPLICVAFFANNETTYSSVTGISMSVGGATIRVLVVNGSPFEVPFKAYMDSGTDPTPDDIHELPNVN